MATDQTAVLDQGGITVFEAWFGDKNGALALLQFPTEMREFFLRLSDKADLPDSPPAGATWEPFVRGWREGDHYLISLTRADDAAIRPGMVATRMIAVSLLDIEKCESMGLLFDFLRDSHRSYTPEQTIALKQNAAPPMTEAAVLGCVAHHLIHESKPVAILEQKGFEYLIAALWSKLPSKLRGTFGFGFSFTPSDLSVSQANIVSVPTSCETRWRGYQHQCNNTWNQPVSVSTAAFLSDTQAQGFLAFLSDMGLEFQSFADYGRYARLWDDWQHRTDADPEVAFSLLRNLGTLIPSPTHAVVQKEEALQIAAGWLTDSEADRILAQRSIKAGAFPGNANVLGRAIGTWIRSRCLSLTANATGSLAQVILAIESSQSPDWQTWVRDGLEQVLNPLGEPVARMLWTIFDEQGVFAAVAAELPNDDTTEKALVRTFPHTVSSHLYSSLKTWCENRGWLSLLATSAFSYLGFAKAVALIVSQKNGWGKPPAIELLCASAEPSEVWDAGFKHADETVEKCAITAALANPELWIGATADLNRWVSLLEAAATRQLNFLLKTNADAVTARLFEAWEKGAPITAGVLQALEKANRLDFTRYANRDRLWARVPSAFLHRARTNTLRTWLRDYYLHRPAKPQLEKELVQILFESRQLEFTFPKSSPSLAEGGFLLVKTWGDERDCENWLHAVASSNSRLSENFAREIGEFVSSKHWMSVARHAKHYDYDWKRHDVWPIWRACYDPLGMLEKLAFDLLPLFSGKRAKSQHSPRSNTMTDAIFVTALAEEFSAVTAHLSDPQEHVESGTIYKIGRFQAGGIDCTVAVVLTGMGNAPSAAATERALALFKPTFAFFVGIAGGLRDDLEIGDVVIADKVYGYEGGKAAGTFKTRPEATTASHEALQRANAVVMANVWQKRINPIPDRHPTALVKPIAAGEKIVASKQSAEFKRLKETYSDAHAVAMEEHGFCVSVKTHPKVCFAVVRGISDLIVKKEEADRAGSHGVAARNAAAFAFEMLDGLIRSRSQSEEERPFID